MYLSFQLVDIDLDKLRKRANVVPMKGKKE